MTNEQLAPLQDKCGNLWPEVLAVVTYYREQLSTKDIAIDNKNRIITDREGLKDSQLAAEKAAHAALAAEFTAYKIAASKAAGAIHGVIADTTKDDAVTVATITQILAYGEREANKTEREREIAAAQAAVAEANAKLEALTA